MTDEADENLEAVSEYAEYVNHHANEAHHYVQKLIDRIPTGEKRNLYTEFNILLMLAQEKLREIEKLEATS
jgi:cellobiose-specific phosphotransferase system component IIA